MGRREANRGGAKLRNLASFLVHLFGRNGDAEAARLSTVHDRCLLCEEDIRESSAYLTYRVCPYCRFHYTLTARERIELLADRGSFKESHKYLSSTEPLSFSQRGKYRNLLSQDQSSTGLTEAAVTGRCRIDDIEVMVAALDFGFMGGSMGIVVGEKVARAFETAARKSLPVVAMVSGGGSRMQEGVLSLMQMAKTVTAANRLREEGTPFIVVLSNPSTGQAYASFANLADVILAEPGSMIGLAPLRALRAASNSPLPLDAHTAEAHLTHGLLDNVVDREVLQSRLATLLQLFTAQGQGKGNHKALLKTEFETPSDTAVWESVTIARHPERPLAMTYIHSMLDPFVELRGDRLNSDDRSIVGGVGVLHGEPVVVIGQQRTHMLEGERYHVYPDGLRKAQRLISLASRFKLPLVTLIDTNGADPGLEAEEQGIGNAVATTFVTNGRSAGAHRFRHHRRGRQRGGVGPWVVGPHPDAAVLDLLTHIAEPAPGGTVPGPHAGPGGCGGADADGARLPGTEHCRPGGVRTGGRGPYQPPGGGQRRWVWRRASSWPSLPGCPPASF